MKKRIHFKSLILGIIIGLVLAGTGVYAAILYQSSDVSYDNTNSGLTSQNVTTINYSGAIKQLNGSNSNWWLRSARSSNTNRFNIVVNIGYSSANTSSYAFGVSPAFRIG